jgi:hypothetical protein
MSVHAIKGKDKSLNRAFEQFLTFRPLAIVPYKAGHLFLLAITGGSPFGILK